MDDLIWFLVQKINENRRYQQKSGARLTLKWSKTHVKICKRDFDQVIVFFRWSPKMLHVFSSKFPAFLFASAPFRTKFSETNNIGTIPSYYRRMHLQSHDQSLLHKLLGHLRGSSCTTLVVLFQIQCSLCTKSFRFPQKWSTEPLKISVADEK